MNIEEKIGSSSIVFHQRPELPIIDAIRLCKDAGFKAMEIHLDDWNGVFGDPSLIKFPGVWPRTCSKEEREALREELADFSTIIVHGTPWDVKIASRNPGIREESVKQYMEAIEFAHDIGAGIVTFHINGATNPLEEYCETMERIVDFGKRAVEYAQKYEIILGAETGTGLVAPGATPIEKWHNVLNGIGSESFGMLLDIGHVLVEMGYRAGTEAVLTYINEFSDKIVEVHAHNVIAWTAVSQILIDHQPFFGDTVCIDVEKVFRKLREVGYNGPIIFEIVGATKEKILKECQLAKQKIIEIWNE